MMSEALAESLSGLSLLTTRSLIQGKTHLESIYLSPGPLSSNPEALTFSSLLLREVAA